MLTLSKKEAGIIEAALTILTKFTKLQEEDTSAGVSTPTSSASKKNVRRPLSQGEIDKRLARRRKQMLKDNRK